MRHNPLLRSGLWVLLIILLSSCSDAVNEHPSVTEVNRVGNEINNIMNGGYVAHQGDWIFYIEPDDHNYIYAKKTDGSNNQRLIKHEASSLNVLGERLFYKSDSDEGGLYSASITGDHPVRLSEAASSLVFVDQNNIYAVDDDRQLWRMKHDGTDQEKLTDTDTPVRHYSVQKDAIIFAQPFADTVYRLDLSTRQLTKLASLPHTMVQAFYTSTSIIYRIYENRFLLYELPYQDPVPHKIIDQSEALIYADEQSVYFYDMQMKKYNRQTKETEVLDPSIEYWNMHIIPGRIFYMDHPNRKLRHLQEIRLD